MYNHFNIEKKILADLCTIGHSHFKTCIFLCWWLDFCEGHYKNFIVAINRLDKN